MSHNCPKKFESANVGRPAPTSAQVSIPTKTTKNGIEGLLKSMKDQLTTDNLKQKFFNRVIEKGFV